MEEEKTAQEGQKMSYEELKDIASNLHVQNQRLAQENKQMRQALENRDFDYSSFFLSMLFKVLDHPNRYDDRFVKWCTKNIEASLTSFADAARESAKAHEEQVEKSESEKKSNEA